jgi:hypothetical protein
MKEMVNLWLSKNARLPGVLACGVRYNDKVCFTQTWSSQYKADALENALRCVADAFQVFQLNRFGFGCVRWVYENAFIYCARRKDGTSLTLVTTRDPLAFDRGQIEQLLGEFHRLGADQKS